MTGRSDRKSTRLNSSHTEIYTLSLHDALPIYAGAPGRASFAHDALASNAPSSSGRRCAPPEDDGAFRSEEHTSELQSHRDLHSFPTRRSSDLCWRAGPGLLRARRASFERPVILGSTLRAARG